MGWGNVLDSAVNGYLRGQGIVVAQDRQKKDDEWRDEQRARQRKQDAEADALQADLKTAGRTVAVDQGAGGMVKPPEMDNRDVGLAENAALPNDGLQQGGYQVAGKAYADQAGADAAAADANKPEAVNARVAGAYRSHGNVDKAMAIENADRQGELQKIQLADVRWKRDLGTAMRGGHDGLATLATNSEAGPMAGLQVKAVPSEDGKSVTYSAVGKDGTLAPIPGIPQFSNDQRGLIQAAYMLDRTIDPSARMAHFDQQDERERQQKNSDRQFDQQASQFNQTLALHQGTADRQNRLADVQIAEAQRAAKIPQATKMAVEGLREEAKTIGNAIVKAQADGTWDATTPNGKALLERQAVVNAQIGKHLAPFMKEDTGATDPFGLKKPSSAGAGRGSAPNSYKDPLWDSAEQDASRKTGVPTEVLRTIRTVGERSNGDQVSPAGAKGVYQFIPSTRDAFIKKYGVDAYSKDPNEQALAAAYHLKESYDRTGSWDKAMAGFNGGPTAEKGTNKTTENRDYAARTSMALAAHQRGGGADFGKKAPGMVEKGNIDLNARPVVKNADGSISTVRSISVNFGGKEVLIPTVSPDGKVLSDDDAVALYKRTGQHLGKFDSPQAATAYAENLHSDQDKLYSGPDPMDALYKKQVNEMNKGLRNELSSDVREWRARKDQTAAKEGEQRFNAAQAAYLQTEKLRAQQKSKDLVASVGR